MTYSDTEREAALSQILSFSPRYSTGVAGTRETGTSFSELQSAALGVFLVHDGAPFYVVLLARDRLAEIASSTQAIIGDLDRYAVAIGRNVTPVTNTTSLNNAKAALQALSQATARRTGMPSDIENLPAFMRFDNSTQKFLDEEGKKINDHGSLIETPEQARSLLKTTAVSLKKAYDVLMDKAEVLANCISSFSSLELPKNLSQELLGNAADVLNTRVEELESKTPSERLEILREVVLDLLSIRSTVKGFGAISPPTTFVLLEGDGELFADEDHPATPASILAGSGGYRITDTERYIDFMVDGIYSISYPSPGSFPASLELVGSWPREIITGQTHFKLTLKNEGTEDIYNINLPAASYTPITFMSTVNPQLALNVLEVIVKLSIPRTTQEVSIVGTGPSGVYFNAPASVDFVASGVSLGNYILVNDRASSGYRSVYSVVFVFGNQIVGDRIAGSSSNGETGIEISVGPADSAYPSIRAYDFDTAVDLGSEIIIEDVDEGTVITLGQVSGARVKSVRTSAENIRDDLNVQPYTYVSNAPRMKATSEFVIAPEGTVLAHSHPEDPTAMSLYLYRGRARVTTNGYSALLQLLDEVPGTINTSGKAVIVRESTFSSDIYNHGVLSSMIGDNIGVNFTNPLQATPGTELIIEAGYNLYQYHGLYRDDLKVKVDDGSLQDGIYSILKYIESPATSLPLPFEVQVDPSVKGHIDPGYQPVYFEAEVGYLQVRFSSLSTGTDSKIEGTSNAVFWTPSTVIGVGTTPWIKLPSLPSRLEIGDLFELHLTNPRTPDYSITIDQILTVEEAGVPLIHLSQELPLSLSLTLNFSTSSTVPFARIRKQVKQNYDTLSEGISDWLEARSSVYFTQLNAAVNSLLIHKNPTSAQVGTLRNHLGVMTAALSDFSSILSSYNAGIVDEVDQLIKAYKERGADRAVDILTSADFETFFSLDADSASYTGNLQKSLRDIQREDLPVRKDNRANFDQVYDDTHIASFEDWDPERIMEEADPLESVEIPELSDVFPDLPIP